MMIFDFLKKFFGWADEGTRKRRADESSTSHEEFVRAKRHRYNHDMGHQQATFIDPQPIEDNDDIEILTEQTCHPVYPTKFSNGVNRDKMKPFTHSKSATFLSPVKNRASTTHMKRNDLSMSCFAEKTNASSCTGMDKSYSTLAKTHMLREKRQYGEMLQNFVPHRIQILNTKAEDLRVPLRNAEIIDLERYEPTSLPPKVDDVTRTPFVSNTRWYLPHKAKKDRISPNKSKTDHTDKILKESFSGFKSLKDEAETSKTLQHDVTLESVATNSLRDRFSAKAVLKNDFIPQVSKRYDVRIEQRNKEAEELKRMAGVLSKQNRVAREAALEEQLARSMRLCEAVLDEREEPEEPPLPTITSEMQKEIKNALVPRPPSQVLVEGFGLQITRKDIHTLNGLNWLNDEVINYYMNLLIERGASGKFPKVHAMNTFFYPKLLSGGHASLKRWTRKVDIFAKDLLVVPVHLGIHWCMSLVDFRDKTIRYYDSMGGSNPKCLSAIKQYLLDESLDKKKKPFDMTDWKLESVKNIPQQMNGSDCGVFSCMFAEYICGNKKITFSQQDMPYFRSKMVYEILKSKLL